MLNSAIGAGFRKQIPGRSGALQYFAAMRNSDRHAGADRRLALTGVVHVPTDGAAQEGTIKRLKGGSLAIVFAGAVTTGSGLMKIGFVAHGLQLGRHLSCMCGMNAVICPAGREQDWRIGVSGRWNGMRRGYRYERP